MIAKTIYEIKFINEQGATLKTLAFDFINQRDDLYNSIDRIYHKDVPAGCTKIEKWDRVTAAATPRRRSVVTGRYKGGAY